MLIHQSIQELQLCQGQSWWRVKEVVAACYAIWWRDARKRRDVEFDVLDFDDLKERQKKPQYLKDNMGMYRLIARLWFVVCVLLL